MCKVKIPMHMVFALINMHKNWIYRCNLETTKHKTIKFVSLVYGIMAMMLTKFDIVIYDLNICGHIFLVRKPNIKCKIYGF